LWRGQLLLTALSIPSDAEIDGAASCAGDANQVGQRKYTKAKNCIQDIANPRSPLGGDLDSEYRGFWSLQRGML
jgi:hypothetical protein